MLPKVAWVLLPLAVYGVVIAVAAVRGRLPSRQALNVQTSLLLMTYLLATASLGIFWVANQQLPVFDWHYLFGYCTVLLVTIHLCFNLPLALRTLRGPPRKAAVRGGKFGVAKVLLIAGALGAAFFLGTRQRANDVLLSSGASTAPSAAVAALIRYHEVSSDSRGSVFTRAPGIEWGAAPPSFKAYPDARHIRLEAAASARAACPRRCARRRHARSGSA